MLATRMRQVAMAGVLPSETFDGWTDTFLDQRSVVSSTGVTFTVNTPTKYVSNPIFTTGTETDGWDRDKHYPSVIKNAAGWHMFYTGVDTGGSTYTCYATSTDGLTWTKPNLGLVTYGGNTNNNILVAGACLHALYDAPSAKWVLVQEPNIKIYTSDSPSGPFTLVKTISPTLIDTTTPEGKGIVRRADGKWVAYYVAGHDANDRSVYAYVSDTTAIDGTYTHYGIVLDANATTSQYYGLAPVRVGSMLYAHVGRYNKTSEQIDVDLFHSRDGLLWRKAKDSYIPLGAASAWDDEMILRGTLTEVGDSWHLYYAGAPANHAAALPRDTKIGRATIDRRRVGQVGTTGNLVTIDLAVSVGATMTVNCNASGGSLKIEVQDSAGTPLTGYAEADFDTVTTDVYDHTPTWGGNPLPDNQTLRLKFVLSSATLYGYEISDAASAEFTPADIADLKSWLAADQLGAYEDGQTIARWDDRSGNANHGANSTAYAEPSWHDAVVNGLPVVRFDGTSEALVWTTTAGAFTMFAVAKYDNTTLRRLVSSYDGSGALTASEYVMDNSGGWRFLRGTAGALTGGTADTLWHYRTYRTGASGGKVRNDGADVATTATAYSTGSAQFYIGEDRGGIGGGSEYFDGDLAELILYDRQLSDSEVADVEAYLAAKYAL